MLNKKIFMSVSATAVIAAAFIGADEADAASYKVENGDSLWKIAQKFDTNVSTLKSINHLTTDLIFPNQVIQTTANSSANKDNKDKAPSKSTSTNTANKAASYTVKSGDTLSGIAFKHHISLSDLMKWNKLDTTLIYPGNVLVVRPGSSSSNSSSNTSSSNTNKETEAPKEEVSPSTVYTVKSGDTLSEIARHHHVTVANLRKWNNLKSDLILIGQKLNIGEGKTVEPPKTNNNHTSDNTTNTNVSYNVSKLISVANGLKGIPYKWGGQTTSGFDCSGFIYYTYKQAGMNISRLSSGGYYNRSFYVNKPQVGDLVFFENTYKSGISHLGIYIGNNQFINANSDGVNVDSLDNPYWSKHFEGFKRFY